jgi:hypothetical protein
VEVDPISCGIITIGKLDSSHLSDHDSTLIDQALNCRSGGVLRGVQVVVGSVTSTRSQSLDVVNVLDTQAQLGFIKKKLNE